MSEELLPCPFEAAKWKGEPCPNPSKGWITDSHGNRITRLGNRNAFGKLISQHNNEIELLKQKTRTPPEGFVLVPVEPTNLMLEHAGIMNGYEGEEPDKDHIEWYKIMIQAAQKEKK